jgi:hypothetical protein
MSDDDQLAVDLARLAIAVALAAPERRNPRSHSAAIPWHLIERIRATLGEDYYAELCAAVELDLRGGGR